MYIFEGEKNIIQKTDNIELFSYSIVSLSTYGYILNKVSLDLHGSNCDDNVMTEYEKRFCNKGIKICMLCANKKN